jgi:hypothetical protein
MSTRQFPTANAAREAMVAELRALLDELSVPIRE